VECPRESDSIDLMFSVLTRIRLDIVAGSHVLPRVVWPYTPGTLWLGIKWYGDDTIWVMIVLFFSGLLLLLLLLLLLFGVWL